MARRTSRSRTSTPDRPYLDDAALEAAAGCLKTLAHPTRIHIVQLLFTSRYSVGEIADECGIASNLASEHLRRMELAGFLTREREGKCIYYSVREPHLEKLLTCIEGRFGKP